MNIWIRITLALAVLLGLAAVAQDSSSAIVRAIGETAFTVPAHAAKQYRFVVPAGANGATLEGHFAATGGPRNSIEVWVMSDDQFVNWTNRHPRTTLYNSQKVTQGTIKLSLPSESGIYHVVFNNEFSVLTPKAIETNLTLKYTK